MDDSGCVIKLFTVAQQKRWLVSFFDGDSTKNRSISSKHSSGFVLMKVALQELLV